MCFGGGSQTETTQNQGSQQFAIPQNIMNYYDWQNQQSQGLYGLGQGIYNSMAQYQPYTGQQVQPFTNAQNTAMNMAMQNAGVGVDASGNPIGGAPLGFNQLGNAAALTNQGAQSYADMGGQPYSPNSVQTADFPSNVGQYLDPYTQQAIGGTLNNMERLRQQSLMGNDASAVGAGAFGGDRQAIADAVTNRNWGQIESNTIAGMQNQNYMNAGNLFNQDQSRGLTAQMANQGAGLNAFQANAGQFNTDQARMLQAAQESANLGGQAQQMGQTNANNVMNVGNVQQNLGQQNLNTAYTNFLNQQQWPEQQYAFLQSAFRQQPFLNNMGGSGTSSGTTTADMPQPGAFQDVMGLGFLGAALGNAFMPRTQSSRQYKEGGVAIDPDDALDAITKMPVEGWRYKGDAEPHIGTYAEEFHEETGLGDGKSIPVVDAIGVLMGGLQAVAAKLHRLENDR